MTPFPISVMTPFPVSDATPLPVASCPRSNPLCWLKSLLINPFVAWFDVVPILVWVKVLAGLLHGLDKALLVGLCADGLTSLSHPVTISINCLHLSLKSNSKFLSNKPGYNEWVVSIASLILPPKISFCNPKKKTYVSPVASLGVKEANIVTVLQYSHLDHHLEVRWLS